MQRSELLATVEDLCDVELDLLDRDELAAVVAASARVRGWLDTVDLRCSRRGRNLADAGQAEPSPSILARSGNRSNRDAIQIDRRDKVAEAMPSLEDGLSDGTVSAGHLDAVANATRNAPPEVRAAFAAHEEELTAFAASESIEGFTRRCRALVAQLTTEITGDDASELDRQRADSNIRRWLDAETGMCHTHAALDPLRDEILWNAINRSLRRRQQLDGNARTPWNQMQVDALIDAVQGGPGDRPPGTAERTPAAAGRVSSAAPRGPAPNGTTPPPSPAAGIARDLADAITRNLSAHGHPVDEPDPDWDHDAAADLSDDEHSDFARSNGEVSGGEVSGGELTEFEQSDGDPFDGEQSDDDQSEAVLRRIEQRAPEISVLVDLATLTGGQHADGICETEDGIPLPVSTIRRLCCDAEIFRTVLDADGVPINLGRSVRTVNRAQRRALRAMHRTCARPGCTVPFSQTKIHHIRWWTRDRGPTDIDNLLPLCERDHHLVHEGRWTLTMTPDRVATWTRPDGTIHHTGSTIDRHPPASSPPAAAGP